MREVDECEDRIEAIADLPPSTILVFKVLQYNERLTHDELCEETRLSKRLVREAAFRLRNLGVITIESGRGESTTPVYVIASGFAKDSDGNQNEDCSEE